MSEEALIKLFEQTKTEIAKGGDWRERVINSVKYKLLDAKYDSLDAVLNKAEEYMKGTNIIEYHIKREIERMIVNRERLNYKVKTPFFDDIGREVKRIKTILTYYNIPNYKYDLEFVDEMVKKILIEEADKHGLKFRD